jgi:hypothetical protein
VCFHHTNADGEIAGRSDISQVFDTILQLEKIEGTNYRKISGVSRYGPDFEPITVEMIFKDGEFVKYVISEAPPLGTKKKLSLDNKILQEFEKVYSLSFDELVDIVGASNETSVKNSLARLAKKGLVEKADGKSWNLILSCMEDDSYY